MTGLFRVEECGPQTLRGVAEPIPLYRVVQPSGVRSRFQARAARGLTPFVGREEERSLLRQRFERARDGEGQVVLLVGEPGIGKSRLAQVLREDLTGTPHTWLESGGAPYFANTPFYAVTELVGEERVHGIARGAGKIALTRYTVLPVISVFFLTNPMAYTFGSFLEEKHKPAFYDAAVSYVHPPLGLFPHVNPGEYFVWGGVLVALLELESRGAVESGYHIRVAIWYAIVGLIVILLKGILTERITAIMARRQGFEL